MKTKFSGFLTLLLAFVVQLSFAQERSISGVISDETGQPLPGVNVIVEGTSTGTQTDFDGNYVITAADGQVLVISYVGYATQRLTVQSNMTSSFQLSPDGELDEVVIVAQGISREKKSLGYAVTTIASEEIQDKAQTDVGRLLQGKSPGVRITSTGGVAGSGTNIIIRGYSSISGGNQPLFIVDGVPFASDTNQLNSFVSSSNTASRFGDLDPNSIASISVLRGLSATALYGEEGKNGVILITTKKGGGRASKTEVTVSSSLFLNEIRLPDYQDDWGNGFFNDYGPFFSNWGSRFDSQATIPNSYLGMLRGNGYVDNLATELFPNRPDLNSETIEYRPFDSQEEYFRTGTIQNTSVSLAGGSAEGSYLMNYSHLEDEGFIPGNTVRRNNLSIGGSMKLSNKFTINGKLNYAKFDKKSPMTDASFGSDVFGAGIASIWNVLYTPRSVDLQGYPFQHPVTGESLWYRANNGRTNPLWTSANTLDNSLSNRVFGNAFVGYDVTDRFNVAYRFGLDYYTEDQTRAVQRGSQDGAFPFGYLRTATIQNTILDHTLLLTLDKINLFNEINASAVVGVNLRRRESRFQSVTSDRQLENAFGLLRHNVFENTDGANSTSEINNQAIYANVTMDYDNWAFLNISARNDWASQFEQEERSVFSYGASLSLDITNAIEGLNDGALDYLKVRAAYGQAPGFAAPYSTRPNLALNSEAFNLGGTNIASNFVQNFLPNPGLRPEVSTEIEFGLEARFFKRRLSFEATYYNKDTEDQIINRPIPSETGFTSFADNFGNVNNEGVEIGFTVVPFRNDDWLWDLSGSYNINENIVTDTQGQIVQIAGFGGGLGNYAIEGEAFGIIQGSVVERDANGNFLVDDNGDYLVATDNAIIGDPNPDWTLSVVNGVSYKNWNLTAQVEYQHGGDMFARTVNTLLARGLTEDTNFDRLQSFVLPGVNANTGAPNTVNIAATDAYFTNYGLGAQEFNVYDMTHIRLREVALGYTFPSEFLDKTPFGSLSVTLQAYNVFVDAVNVPDSINFDPDINSVGVGNGQGFDFLTSWNSRRFGGSVKLTF